MMGNMAPATGMTAGKGMKAAMDTVAMKDVTEDTAKSGTAESRVQSAGMKIPYEIQSIEYRCCRLCLPAAL